MYLLDRGTALTARHTQRFVQKCGITQSMTRPFSLLAHSIVERANGIIPSPLKKITDKDPEKLDVLLPNAPFTITTTRQNPKRQTFHSISLLALKLYKTAFMNLLGYEILVNISSASLFHSIS
ncbi:hypothetical protein NPIL_193311 [Nephila pilipes]|uniref:Integrase catalytic domain-containing protein n=1 Tax=Nephila pilipes TaxID=299642 RepID=A0A8X6NEW7_NEPPI|nr:hypothetical protein NPIL_193311 [Nephila pilipes]